MANNWRIYASCQLGGCLCGCGAVHFLEYTFVLDIYCQQLVNMCQLNILVLNIFRQQLGDIWQFDDVFVLGKVNFLEYTFVLYIHCQQLWNMCHLNIYIGIVYTLPTIGKYMTVGWCWGCAFSRICMYHLSSRYPLFIPQIFPNYSQDITQISPW